MEELKPCPFCGSDKIQFLISGHFQPWDGAGMRLWYRCACYECGAEMNSGMATTMKEATKEWNRRRSAYKMRPAQRTEASRHLFVWC